MALSSITAAASSATSNATDSATSLAKLSQNYTQFLKLLTTQLQNQDPLKPMDTKDFTQQLVQFAGVEQSIATNKNLEALLQLQTANQAAQANSYIGRTVEAIGDKQALVDGKATWGYAFEGTPKTVQLFISDKDGKVVYQTTGQTTAGGNSFAWDGKDMNGLTAPAGEYTMRVSALDAAGNNVKTSTSINVKIDGVEMSTSGARLLAGKQVVNINDIIRVKAAA
jgi:flagellar basal-body rod modification protein FlgD